MKYVQMFLCWFILSMAASEKNIWRKVENELVIHKADIRMGSHGMPQPLDDKSVAQNLLSTGLLQIVSRSCNKPAIDMLQQVWS